MDMKKTKLISNAIMSANELMKKHNVSTEDMRQEVYMGVIDALNKLDEDDEYSSYAIDSFVDEIINKVITDAEEEKKRNIDDVLDAFKAMYAKSQIPSGVTTITMVQIINNKFDPIEKRIIELRYGINNTKPCKYVDCRKDIHIRFGREIPISVIKEMELTALKKLRNLLSNL